MNEEVKSLVLPGPMVSLRSARTLSRCLARAKLYPLHWKEVSKNMLKIIVRFVVMYLILTYLLLL